MFLKNVYKGPHEWWLFLITSLMFLLGYLIGQLPISGVLIYAFQNKYGRMPGPEDTEMLSTPDFAAFGLDLNLVFVLLMFMFIGALFMLWLFLKLLHKRNLKSLITPYQNINWSKIFFAFFLWLGFAFVLEGITYFTNPEVYHFQFEAQRFFILLLLSLTLLPLQTSTEELFFRGYLMQGISLASTYRVVPLIISSILFGAMHLLNPEVAKFGMATMATYYIGVAFFLGMITLLDDSLELALGVHAATNFFSAVFVSYDGGALQTYALVKTEVVNMGIMMPIFFSVAAIFTFICWKKYNWEGWHKVFGKNEGNLLEEEMNLKVEEP